MSNLDQDIVTRILHERALQAGFYQEADIMRFQNDEADNIILSNLPVDTPIPTFNSYLDKINYIVSCGYGIY